MARLLHRGSRLEDQPLSELGVAPLADLDGRYEHIRHAVHVIAQEMLANVEAGPAASNRAVIDLTDRPRLSLDERYDSLTGRIGEVTGQLANRLQVQAVSSARFPPS